MWRAPAAHGLLWGLSLLFCVGQASAATDPVLLAKIFFKTATYDLDLPKDTLKVAVVYPKSDTVIGPKDMQGFRSVATMKVSGRQIKVLSIAYQDPDELAKIIKDTVPYGLFVSRSVPSHDLAHIRRIARSAKALTFAAIPEWVHHYFAVGVSERDGKRKILVNTTLAQELGRRLDGAFLSVCEVIQ